MVAFFPERIQKKSRKMSLWTKNIVKNKSIFIYDMRESMSIFFSQKEKN